MLCGYELARANDSVNAGFVNLFAAIYDAQAQVFFGMLGYEILGVNIAGLVIAIVALGILAFILKKVIK